MRKRTPSEIKAYGDGYIEAYKEFCHLLDRHEKDKAIRKMKIFADAVALTVETATDTADTPQTERKCIDCRFLTYMYGKTWCNIKCDNPRDKVCDRFKPKDEQTDCAWMYDSRRDYEYDKALDEMERNFVEFEEYDDGEDKGVDR